MQPVRGADCLDCLDCPKPTPMHMRSGCCCWWPSERHTLFLSDFMFAPRSLGSASIVQSHQPASSFRSQDPGKPGPLLSGPSHGGMCMRACVCACMCVGGLRMAREVLWCGTGLAGVMWRRQVDDGPGTGWCICVCVATLLRLFKEEVVRQVGRGQHGHWALALALALALTLVPQCRSEQESPSTSGHRGAQGLGQTSKS